MPTTKIYQNNSDEAVNVIGVGEIPAGEHISVTSDYHQPVVLANYPGVVEVVEEEQKAADEAPQEPAQPEQPQQEPTHEETV